MIYRILLTRDKFAFSFHKNGTPEVKKYMVIPYQYSWDGTREGLKTHSRYGCSKNTTVYVNFCAKLIQDDGWEIKDDYPW